MVLEALFALLGVIVGFALDSIRETVKDRQAEQQTRRNVRILLQAEIDHNVAWLQMIKEMLDLPEGPDKMKSWGAIGYYLNGLSFDVWRSQTAALPGALSSAELKQAISHYANLSGALDARGLLLAAARPYLTGEESDGESGGESAKENPGGWGEQMPRRIGWYNRDFSISENASVVQEYIAAALEDYPRLKA